MPEEPENDNVARQIDNETKSLVRDFVRAAASSLSDELKDKTPEWEVESLWERGDDGHFRERAERTRILWLFLNAKRLHSLPDYDTFVSQLKSDRIVGPHLEHLVGTHAGASRIDADVILQSMLYSMVDDQGGFAFTDEQFEDEWQEWADFFESKQTTFKTIAPLPRLVISDFPLQLNDELSLDRLTEDEVTRCCSVGVLRPVDRRFPLIYGEDAVGIRYKMSVPKVILKDAEPAEQLGTTSEGSFGSRPLLHTGLIVDDVLSALRLFKHTGIRTAGHASWTDIKGFSAGTSYRVLNQWPYGGGYELSPEEVTPFLELWNLLEEGAADLGFSIHRFNLAFEPRLLADRIVDLVIAAESLFLSDLDVPDRGELRFRFALRAGKFIEHPDYTEHDIYRVMRRAYDARSAIVHGGSPDDTRLPDNQDATLPAFIDAIEELVRLGLRKALSMKQDGKKLREAAYWEGLLFPDPSSS